MVILHKFLFLGRRVSKGQTGGVEKTDKEYCDININSLRGGLDWIRM